jgi:uncharacterized membrane protein
MQCPQCKSILSSATTNCPQCNHPFTPEIYEKLRLSILFNNEIHNLKMIQTDITRALESIESRSVEFDAALRDEMSTAQVAPEDASKPATASAVPTGDSVVKSVINKLPVQARPPEPPTGEAPPPSTGGQEPGGGSATDFEIQVGQRWALILGIVAMVFGVGYFLKFSFEQGWVGPAARVTLSYILGASLLGTGELFRRRQLQTFGLNLAGGGIAVLYFSTFAGFQFYHLIDQIPAFFFMVLITALAGSLSVLYEAKWLAVLGLIGGFLTPIFLSTGEDNQIALMSYMVVLNVGLLGIAFHKRWDLLNILGLIFTYLLYTIWYGQHYADGKFWPAIIFLQIFYGIYIIAPFAYEFAKGPSEALKGPAILTANSFIAFGLSYAMIRDHFSGEWAGMISILYSAVFLSLAHHLNRSGRRTGQAFYVFVGNATLFLILTVPIIFSRHWITIFWAAQAVTLLWVGQKLDRKGLINAGYVLMMISILKFLIYDYTVIFQLRPDWIYFSGGYLEHFVERSITTAVLITIAYGMGRMASAASLQSLPQVSSPSIRDSAVVFGVWGAFLFIVFNVEVAAFFYDYLMPGRFAAISVLWTLFSGAVMIKGFKDNILILRKLSLGLFGVVILKVFLFDISRFSVPYRIVSFIILGAVLIVTSYLYYRFKDKIQGAFLGGLKTKKT